MKRILLASVALMALALAAPYAGAQYPDPTPAAPAYETQVPDQSTDTTDPMAPEVTPQAQTAPDPTAPTDPMAPSDPATAEAQADVYAEPAPTTEAQTSPEAAPDAYAQTTPAVGPSIDLTDEAVMAGMDSVPMTATEVCEPRSVSLTQSGSRLNRDARRHLINATDHASVCEMQRIVVRSPSGRADAAVATLVDLGVDSNLIQVEQAADGGLGLEMQFAGVATSSEEYAAMFNPVQTASLTPGETPAAPTEPAPETDMSQPGSHEPSPTGYEPVTPEPTSYEPSVEETTPSPIY